MKDGPKIIKSKGSRDVYVRVDNGEVLRDGSPSSSLFFHFLFYNTEKIFGSTIREWWKQKK